VIFGYPLSLVCPVPNIIWPYLMISLIIYGPFPYVCNLTRSLLCPNFLHISLLSSVAQFRVASATTGRNSTMYPDGPFYSPTSSCCACHAHTLPYKMVKLSALSAPSILLFAHYFSKLPWQHTNGWRAFTLLHTYSTIYPPRRSMPHVPMLPCSAHHHPTSTFMCSVVPGTPIYPP
jgi:hypothetical protein